jgi:hypothetical protein
MNIILSNYFTSKIDPQRETVWERSGQYRNISGWVESIIKLKLNGIIFHDNLSDHFIQTYTNEYIQFIPYKVKTMLCLNDERFICWYEHLKENQYDKVFVTDLFDVTFNKNPFDLITDEFDIYAGIVDNERKVCDSPIWSIPMQRIYGKLHYSDKPLINAGVIGGNQSNMLKLFEAMVNDFNTYNNVHGSTYIWEGDIPVFNKNLYDLFDKNKLLLGHPVTSEFKKYQEKGDFFIKHK